MRMHSPSQEKRQASQTMHSGPFTASDFSPRNWNFAPTVGSSTTSGTWSRGFRSKTFTGQTSLQCEQPVHLARSMSTWTIGTGCARGRLLRLCRGAAPVGGPDPPEREGTDGEGQDIHREQRVVQIPDIARGGRDPEQ